MGPPFLCHKFHKFLEVQNKPHLSQPLKQPLKSIMHDFHHRITDSFDVKTKNVRVGRIKILKLPEEHLILKCSRLSSLVRVNVIFADWLG